MKILLDTNVVLDLLLAREPFVEAAREIFVLAESRELEACLCATSLTTLHYLMQKAADKAEADTLVATLLELFEVAPVDKDVLIDASVSNGTDYEDSVIAAAAKAAGMDRIVTRDNGGFKNSTVPVLHPDEFLAFWRMRQEDL